MVAMVHGNGDGNGDDNSDSNVCVDGNGNDWWEWRIAINGWNRWLITMVDGNGW